MNTKNLVTICTAILAVVLASTLLSAPADAGDFGPTKTLRAYVNPFGPDIGPLVLIGPYKPKPSEYVHKPNEYVGQPGSKIPEAYQGSGKSMVTLGFKIGAMRWGLKLEHPVWIPALDVFTPFQAGE